MVNLFNEYNCWEFSFFIKKKEITTFLFAICIELIKRNSKVIDIKAIPKPLNILGNFIIQIERTNNYEQINKIEINCNLFKIFKSNISFKH